MSYTSATNTKIVTFLNLAQTKIGEAASAVATAVSEAAPYQTYEDEAMMAYELLSFIRSLDSNFNDWTEAEIIKYIDKWNAKASLSNVAYLEHSELNVNIVFN